MRNNVFKWLDDTAKKHPNKIAISDNKGSISFAEYRSKAQAIARAIIELGHRKKPVVVYMEKGKEILVSFAGIGYSGNFYSPIDTSMPLVRVNRIVETLEPTVVVTTRELKHQFEEFSFTGQIIIYEEVFPAADDEEVISGVQSRVIDTDLLYVLFTSGSTGNPKGVGITHRAVYDYIDWVTETFDINSEDVFGNQAPFYFDNSILDIYSTMKTGAELVIIPSDLFGQPVPLLEYLKECNINTIFWVPSALMIVSRFKALDVVDLSSQIKRVLFCGEVMPTKQLNVWIDRIPDAVYANLYGPTEITDACTYYIINRKLSDEESLPIGIPMNNTDILVLADDDSLVNECDTDTIGELCVRGTGVSVGYYNNPKKTAEAFVQNPLNTAYDERIYRTGDLVKYNQYGELLYLCRKDFQIKHMGHRIELGEIETAYYSLDNVPLGCCLYDDKHKRITLITEGEVNKKLITELLKSLIPDYMIPGKFLHIEKMPFNANGKIDRAKLKELI